METIRTIWEWNEQGGLLHAHDFLQLYQSIPVKIFTDVKPIKNMEMCQELQKGCWNILIT